MKELYEKYKGMAAKRDGIKGVVCGYNHFALIAAVTHGKRGWHYKGIKDVMVTHQDNKLGYIYVDTWHICSSTK